MHGSEWFLTKEKVRNVFFSPKFPYKDETWCISLIYGSIFSPQGGVYRHFFSFKAFKECLPHFHSTQFSLWHDGYKCFTFQLSYFDEKTEIPSFFGKNLSMSDLNTILFRYRWPHNDVTATCIYHFDNGIVLSTSNFISTDGFSAFTPLLGEFPTVSHW